MPRKLSPGALVVATHNAGKLAEIDALVAPYGLTAKGAAEFGLVSPEETETTFEGNARIKAHHAAREVSLPALADDSGLDVTALGGAPGVYSADWAGAPRDFALAMSRVEAAMTEVDAEDFSARFVCCLCLAWPDGHEELFKGRVEGRISFPPRGEGGFGYDPIFTPKGAMETFGEMDADRKRRISHRTDAFRKLERACLKSSPDG